MDLLMLDLGMCFGTVHQDEMKSTHNAMGVQPIAFSLFLLHCRISDRCAHMKFKPVHNQTSFVHVRIGYWL
jgi:hypothetical protein